MLDDIEQLVGEKLGSRVDAGQLEALAAIRARFDAYMVKLEAKLVDVPGDQMIAQINTAVDRCMAAVADVLGAKDYEQLFGVQVGEPIRLVDEEVFLAQFGG